MIIQHPGSPGNRGHLPVVGRDLPVDIVVKKFLYVLPRVRILHQLHPHDLGADLLGQIILRGPQAAGENHDVRPAHRRGDDLLHPAVIVANCHLVVHVKSQHGAFFRQILGVAVQNISHQNFRSHGNQLYRHVYMLPSVSTLWFL